MKVIKRYQRIVGAIITLALIGVAFSYYVSHREIKEIVDPIEDKNSDGDSATHAHVEDIPNEMGRKPETDAMDGSVKIVEDFIKSTSKKPATLEFLEWSEISNEGPYWKVRCKYRGISSFNADVTTNAWFYIQKDKIVYTKIISKI